MGSIAIQVKRAKPEERKDLEQLIRRCGKNVRDYFEMRNTAQYWADGEVWKATVVKPPLGPEVVGFAVVHALKREPVLSLYQIGVDPEWRQFGVASDLMLAIWLAYPDAERIRLVVSKDNATAQRVYAQWGLKVLGERETRRNGLVIAYEGRPKWG